MYTLRTPIMTLFFHIFMVICMLFVIFPNTHVVSAQSKSSERILDPRRIPQSKSVAEPQACTPMPACVEPQFYVVYGQSKTNATPMSAASRTVVLNWTNSPNRYGPIGAYRIYRRVSPALPAANVMIAQTGILATESGFTTALSATPGLLNTLRVVMNNTGYYTDTLTTTQLYNKFLNLNTTGSDADKLKARIAVQKFPALAQAVGLGYSDVLSTNLTSTLIYTVKRVNTDSTETVVGSVSVAPDVATPSMPAPSNLREPKVYDGPPAVGIINSVQSPTTAERYDGSMQNEVSNDGKVFLMWDRGVNSKPTRYIAGYNVYRQNVGGLLWTKLNTDLVTTTDSQPYATSTFTTTVTSNLFPSYYDDPYYFVDDKITTVSDYKSYKYRVCPVDIANTEGTCSNVITAVKRDLIPPSQVSEFSFDFETYKTGIQTVYPIPASSQPGKVRLTWKYRDKDGINVGNLPQFYITRAITTGVALTNWTAIATLPATSAVITSTYVYTDSPPLNRIFYYRIQVRDNAGNWSAVSAPVKGGVYDRVPPAKPQLAATPQKRRCYERLMSRQAVPSDVRQVLISRRLSEASEWRLIRRLRPNRDNGNPYGVDISDKYVTPLPNTPVYYKIEYLDAYGNISLPASLCVRGNSPNDLLPPRFSLSINNSDNGGVRNVNINFGSTTDIYSRSVVVARPSTTNPANVITTTVSPNASTFQFQIDTGESLRVGAIASALTATTSLTTTLNSRWVRNVNNFLNLNTTPSSTKFLDTPRNMANLGTFAVAFGTANNESCRDTFSPARKVCAMIQSRNYPANETPPMVALFRRLKPSGAMLASDVPWLQVSTITSWTLRSGQYVVEDTTIFDPTRTYEYMAVAHSSKSYEVIGYFTPVTLTGSKLGTPYVNIGTPVNTAAIPQQLPAGCTLIGLVPSAERIDINDNNKSLLPSNFFDDNDDLVNTFELSNNFTFVAEYLVRSKKPICTIGDPTLSTSRLYIIGTLRAGTRVVTTNAMIYNAKLSAPGQFTSTKLLVKFPPMAPASIINPVDPNGLIVRIRDYAYEVDATGVITSTSALTITLPTHIRLAVDTVDPLYSQLRSGVVIFHTNSLDGNYDTDSFVEDLRSNTPFAAVAASGRPGAVIVDEFSPWFYRASGRSSLQADLSGLTFDQVQAFSRTTYAYGSSQFTNFIPDNNSAFVGTYSATAGGRNYVYDSSDTTINMKGVAANLVRRTGISYITSYPAGIQISALGGAAFKLANSVIYSGELITPTVRLKYFSKDSDTSYAKVISTRPVFIRGNYLPIEFGFSYVPTYSTKIITIDNDGILNLGEAGLMTETVTTADTVFWPGFSMQPVSSTLDLTLYLAPATPVGMSTFSATIPKPAESAWEQIDLGYSDESDLDPGLNFNGQNSVDYGCYGSGEFDARMDTYLRMGGFSEHLILQGLGASVKNNTTGYDEALTKYSAIFADNIIVDPSDIESELNLPYPSDVLLPLQAKVFDSNGCPVGGDIGNGSGYTLNHKYWNFSQQAMSFGYASGSVLSRYVTQYMTSRGQLPNPTNITAARTALPPVILQISGTMQPMAARTKANAQANLAGVSEWLPNGEFGNISLSSAVEVFNSGMPFTLNDVILNRYNAELLNVRSQPSTAGFNPQVGGLPSKLLDEDGQLTRSSLADCLAASSEPLGCGFQILDGNNALTYFGEPQKCSSHCVSPSGTAMLPTARVQTRTNNGDTPTGDGSIGSAGDGSEEGDTLWNPVLVQMMWDLGAPALDIPFPVVFLANKSGGVFAGMLKSQAILPGSAEVFKSDISVVVNGRLESTGFNTDIGIFFGYSASQAAFRALATHRPNDNNTGFKPSTNFSDVKDDVAKWSNTFGYGVYDNDKTDKDDPVDLLDEMWANNGHGQTWTNADTLGTSTLNDYKNVRKYYEPKLNAAGATESYKGILVGSEWTGITGLQEGLVLNNACSKLRNGHGAVQFKFVGTDVSLDEIGFGSYIDVKNSATSDSATSGCDSNGSSLITISRMTMRITGDGEISILANEIHTTILEKDVKFDVQLVIGTQSPNQRLEGGLKLYELTVASVKFTDIGVVFGVGQYSGNTIGYFGFSGSGTFKGYGVSASFLAGVIPSDSPVLKAQYNTLMTNLTADNGPGTYKGVYISVGVQIPIYQDGCMREVIANGELRGWYFERISAPPAPASWGGYLTAGVSGEAACLVSARGQLTLTIYSPGDGKLHFDGNAWLAGGVGDCEPNTWNNWNNRWWGDSWCAQAGAYVQVTYVEGGGWDVDYDLAVESPW